MARTALSTLTNPSFGGGTLDIAAAAVDQPNGNTFVNDSRTFLVVINASGGSLTVTVAIPAGPQTQNASTTKTYAVANGKTAFLGPFPNYFNQSTGLVNVDWSTGTSVTCSVLNYTQTPGY